MTYYVKYLLLSNQPHPYRPSCLYKICLRKSPRHQYPSIHHLTGILATRPSASKSSLTSNGSSVGLKFISLRECSARPRFRVLRALIIQSHSVTTLCKQCQYLSNFFSFCKPDRSRMIDQEAPYLNSRKIITLHTSHDFVTGGTVSLLKVCKPIVVIGPYETAKATVANYAVFEWSVRWIYLRFLTQRPGFER